jgi:hypothetical protein
LVTIADDTVININAVRFDFHPLATHPLNRTILYLAIFRVSPDARQPLAVASDGDIVK